MTKRFLIAFAAGLLLLAAVLGAAGLRTSQDLEATVTELFNRQQLSLARQIAGNIRDHFAFLETSLRALDATRSAEAGGVVAVSDLQRLFGELSLWDVLALGHASLSGAGALAITADGVTYGPELTAVLSESLEWAHARPESEDMYVGPDFVPDDGPFAGRHIVVMATRTPAGQEQPTQGLEFLVVDAMAVAQRHARGVRSGQTGYAWVINAGGVFLSHYEDRFIGRSAFDVRAERNPAISYGRINELMVDKLLHGAEGTDWYVSGWHRGVVSEMRKLLAYTPAFYAGRDQPARLWSVALAAPESEVYGIMRPFLRRQWLVTGVSVLLALGTLAFAIFFSLRWAEVLRREVDARTADLRVERDRVRESMARLLEAQERLVRSERFAAVGEAASHLAHEIKNPLLLMGGFAAQARKGIEGDGPKADKLREKLGIIEDEARRLETLLREVSGFTKPSKPRFEAKDINVVALDTLRLVESDFAERGIMCETDLDRSLPPLLLDSDQMRQVLLNLIKNAGEAMPGGGRLILRTWREGDSVKVSVRDTGAGMPPEVLARVFNPFFTTKAKGTGLGLAVSFKIVTDHGGEISATSAEGQGSTFVLTLPVRRCSEPDQNPESNRCD